MNKKAIIALVILVIVVAGAAFWMLRNPTTDTPAGTTTPSSTNDADSNADSGTTTTGMEATITYSDSGFSPSSITVKAGDKVIIKNTSSRSMQFDSDPHPAHTINPELNIGSVPSGQEMSFIVDTKGTFGYHNHLNASQKGTIIVE